MNTDENEIYYQQQLAQMRSELYNSIIQWDLPRARLTGYMFKTLPAYLKAADKVVKSVMEGQSVGGAINDQFEGALLSFILKKMNVEEMQSNPVSPTGEEKKKFPAAKQRIAVCLSKARRNPFPDRNADE